MSETGPTPKITAKGIWLLARRLIESGYVNCGKGRPPLGQRSVVTAIVGAMAVPPAFVRRVIAGRGYANGIPGAIGWARGRARPKLGSKWTGISRHLARCSDPLYLERKRYYARTHHHRQRAARASVPGVTTRREWYDRMRDYGYACAYCGASRDRCRADGSDLTMDHIIPLHWAVIGRAAHVVSNGPENIAPACAACNFSKGTKDVIDWCNAHGHRPHRLVVDHYSNSAVTHDVAFVS